MTKGKWLGWHFLPEDGRLRWGTREVVVAGKTCAATGPLKMCENGMHASRRLIDALDYAPGPIVCRVNLLGERLDQDDKSVARSRRVLWMLDATNLLHEFACQCAEDSLALVENPDPRSVKAIAVKRAWLRGEATDEDLAAARAAAWAAAGDGAAAWVWAGDAAGAAAWAWAWDAAGAAAGEKQNRLLVSMVMAAHRKEE